MAKLLDRAKKLLAWRPRRRRNGKALAALVMLAWHSEWDRSQASSFHRTDLPDEARKTISNAIDVLHAHFGPAMSAGYRGGWDALLDDQEGWLQFDEVELAEARSRAQCGQTADCLHHLERALPQGYGVIAERLAHHVRSR